MCQVSEEKGKVVPPINMQEGHPRILYEDDEILVLDKPSGWIVNEASTTRGTPVVQTWLDNNFDFPIARDKRFRSGIVHRLDKETSGCLIIAKTQAAFENLQSQFKKRVVKKTYTALVHGVPVPEKGKIDMPVGRLPWNRERFGVLPGGRNALTKYKVEKTFSKDGEKYALVSLFPKTGRTHQIRIHLKYLKTPIVADTFYAGRKTSRNDRKWCPRLFLHASGIKFLQPETKRGVEVSSKLPVDLKQVLDHLAAEA